MRKALGTGSCVTTGVGMMAANGVLENLDTMVLGLGQVCDGQRAFNGQLICGDGNGKNCIDLVSVIGGKSNTAKDKGVIGVLSQGACVLLVMAVIIALMLAVWKLVHGGESRRRCVERLPLLLLLFLGPGYSRVRTFASPPLLVMK